jgi:thymidylate synthase
MLNYLLKDFKNIENYFHDENQYLNTIKYIIENGSLINSRNGNVYTTIGCPMHFNLENNTIPILTTKKVAIKTCIKELIWFIKGQTDNKILKNQNVHIWDDNGSRDFLDSRGLTNRNKDDLGPIYGYQWRHFNNQYENCTSDYSGKGIDQLKYIIDSLKHPTEKYSRRLIMTAWNPCQIDEMALPPCHVLCHFNVIDNNLSCILYQRSGDVGLGVPFNISSYCLLTHLIAKICNLNAKEFIYYLGNTHIYDDHIESLKEQILRKPLEFPKIKISDRDNLDIDNISLEDIEIINYQHYDSIKMKMRK